MALHITGFRTLVFNLSAIAVVAAVLAVVTRETLRDKVEVELIDVPRDLEDAGYTPKVIAERLVDGVITIEAAAKTTMSRRGLTLKEQAIDITVPGSSLSIGTVASSLRTALGDRGVKISGEITELRGTISLQLRITGKDTIAPSVGTLEHVDDVIAAGAREIVRAIEPFLLASYLYNVDPSAALDLAKAIVATTPESDESTYRAYNLEGIIFSDRHDYEAAIAAYRKAIALSPRFAIAYNNLGNALRALKRHDEAIASLRKAIELDPAYVPAYNNLGYAFSAEKQFDEAIRYYRKAIELDPSYALAYSNLGHALHDLRRPDEAIASYQKAMELNPKLASAYDGLGHILQDKGQLDEAMALYRKAIELDPKFADAYYSLGTALAGKGQLVEACSVLENGRRLAFDGANYATAMEGIDVILNPPRGCNPS